MRFYSIFIHCFLFIYFCYCHDLNHADPVTVKQSESPVTIESVRNNIDTTNVQKNDNTIDTRFQTTADIKNPIHESKENVPHTTPSVDIPLQNQVPVSIQNDLTSPSTPIQTQATQQPTISSTIKTIPISNDNSHPKVIQNNVQTPVNQQPVDAIQQKRLDENTLPTPQSQQQEQIQPIPNHHIPSPINTQQPISNTIENSNSLDVKLDQVPLKPIETITSDTSTVPTESHIPASTASRVLRSATPRVQQKPHIHPRHVQQPAEDVPKKDANPSENATIKQSNDEHIHSTESSTTLGELHAETIQRSATDETIENKIQSQTNDQNLKPVNNIDLPRLVRVHDSATVLNQQNPSNENSNKNENLTLNQEIENATTVVPVLIHDANTHLPRLLENEEKQSQMNDTSNETNQSLPQIEPKIEDSNNSITSKSNPVLNNTDKISTSKDRQICWHLPKTFEPSIELLENQIFRFINVLPEFMQTIVFGRIDDREVLMNTMWLGSICTMCVLFSFLFLSMGTKRLKQSKNEKEVRARCQQLQQYNNQIDLERATFERQNQKLSDEIDELKSIPVRDADEDLFALRVECTRFQEDLKIVRIERDTLQQNIDYKQNLIQKHEYDMQRQMENVAYLNNEILQLKRDLDKERATVARAQSNDLTLERFEKSQELIQELKSEITQLKQEKFIQNDQLHEIQDHTNQLDIENNQLTLRMKQLKALLEQRDQTIKRIHNKITEDEPTELEDLLSIITENSSNNNSHLLSTIDNDVEKSNQHIRDLHKEIDEKTRRIKELDLLFKQEKDRCKEMETKLKVVLELRERDAHLHIRQLGQTDAELRKARTDTERVRILQQQLELKQQQLDDVQKVLSTEQIKFNEECSKLQHETHEKWMEVKRLTREVEVSKKECEGLRKQITKYANNERSSQEKTMIKPVPQHFGNNGEFQVNGSSPISYQQGEKPIDHQRTDSGATSPVEMFMSRPPPFGLHRPPFFPSQFMPPPPPNAFMMHPRYSMPTNSPHGMISPVPHLIINGNEANSSQIVDASNITPNSTSYDAQSNGGATSPAPDNEKQVKVKKAKKSLKKKTRTSTVQEDV